MKYSKQRELVYQAVLQSACHPTADMIYEAVRAQEPAVSLGTVYRNLGRLVEEGLVRRIVLPNTPDRFDRRLEEHQHLLCQRCGGLFDLGPGVPFHFLHAKRQIESCSPFTVTGYALYFTGVCPGCAEYHSPAIPRDQIENERK